MVPLLFRFSLLQSLTFIICSLLRKEIHRMAMARERIVFIYSMCSMCNDPGTYIFGFPALNRNESESKL